MCLCSRITVDFLSMSSIIELCVPLLEIEHKFSTNPSIYFLSLRSLAPH